MNDLLWIGPALLAGIAASRLGLPPMVGYLLCGFVLNATDIYDHQRLTMIGDLGVTLLLFTVGLKLDLRSLFRPLVWASTTAHASVTVLSFGAVFYLASMAGVGAFAGLDMSRAALVAFALSFSSTVFAVKILEDKGDYRSSYGKTAVGVLVMQDIFAVVFLAASTAKMPSIWAIGLLALIPGRHLLLRALDQAGHSGELQVLYGIALAFGGFALFKAVDVKGDLGALLVGTLLASHPLAPVVSERLMGFKDLLLVGFFLSIGMSGELTMSSVLTALLLNLLLLPKGLLFLLLFTKFKARARTAALSTLLLSTYSEFGLIVGAVGVSRGWLSEDWLVTIALALTISIFAASPVNARANSLYESKRSFLRNFETKTLLPEDQLPDFGDSKIVVVGMGALGTSVYDQLNDRGHDPIGLDIDPEVISQHQAAGRKVAQADATNNELWESTTNTSLETGVVTFKRQNENLCIVTRACRYNEGIEMFAVAEHQDEVEDLKAKGAKAAWNLYTEAGTGLASEVLAHYDQSCRRRRQ